MDRGVELDQLQQGINSALKTYHKADDGSSPLAHLRLFRRQRSDNAREATNRILLNALGVLSTAWPEGADLLTRHFLEEEKLQHIARTRNIGIATAYRWQDKAMANLTQTLLTQEREANAQHRAELLKRLGRPSYNQLVGIDHHLTELLALALTPGPPWLIAIEGLGGLGKTSLADALLRRVIDRQLVEEVGWVNVRRYDFLLGQEFPALAEPALTVEHVLEMLAEQLLADIPRFETVFSQKMLVLLETRLKQQAHLVVIDNLETVADVAALLPLLRDLSNPTKFLLTSRAKLPHEPGVYHFSLPELSSVDALHLLRTETTLSNPLYLKTATDDELLAVYRVVGGNPLALRLVIGQAHFFTLPTILADLSAARGKTVEGLFTFIYRRAWERLNETTRRVFLAMPLVAEGQGSLEHLAALIDINAGDLRDALAWLVTLNLVDRRGDAADPFYTIHSLTRTFLHEQVVRWQ